METEDEFSLRGKSGDDLDDFEETDELEEEFEEDEDSELDEEVDFENPSFSRDQIWNDYAEDLDFDD